MRGESVCAGCSLEMPPDAALTYDGYFNVSPECWSVFGEALAYQYANPVVWGRSHQPLVDAYAVQHAGGPHPDKSVDVHLVGLHLVLERGMAPTVVPAQLQRLIPRVREWPHFVPPVERGAPTVLDVVMAADTAAHVAAVATWAQLVWDGWAAHHEAVAWFAARHLGAPH